MSTKVKQSPGSLHVVDRGERQFGIMSDFHRVSGDWDDVYFDVSGYFGSYGPHAFAVAPDLLQLLKSARPYVEDRLHGRDGEVLGSVAKLLNRIDASISKAEGSA